MKTYIPKNTEFFFVPASDFLNDDGTWMSERLAEEVPHAAEEKARAAALAESGETADAEQVRAAIESDCQKEAKNLEGWYYWTCFPGCLPEGDAIGPFKTEEEAQADAGEEVEDEIFALCQELDVEPSEIDEERHTCYGLKVYSVGRAEYAVGTDEEADEAWDQALDSYLDDTGILDSIPENLRRYFDRDAWKADARFDGRGHALASYDGDEIDLEGGLVAFRIN